MACCWPRARARRQRLLGRRCRAAARPATRPGQAGGDSARRADPGGAAPVPGARGCGCPAGLDGGPGGEERALRPDDRVARRQGQRQRRCRRARGAAGSRPPRAEVLRPPPPTRGQGRPPATPAGPGRRRRTRADRADVSARSGERRPLQRVRTPVAAPAERGARRGHRRAFAGTTALAGWGGGVTLYCAHSVPAPEVTVPGTHVSLRTFPCNFGGGRASTCAPRASGRDSCAETRPAGPLAPCGLRGPPSGRWNLNRPADARSQLNLPGEGRHAPLSDLGRCPGRAR